MKQYLKISNKGKVDPEAFILIGASTKVDDDSKIGMFGSGTKYALAYFMRNNIDVKIFSGADEIKIDKEPIKFRDCDFEKILIGGVPTSLTTSMGKDWECWMAIREIYCNALDEEEHNKETTEILAGEENRTNVYIECTKEVKEVFTRWDNYFSFNRTPIYEDGDVKLFNSLTDLIVYRKGIRCGFIKGVNPVFDYDFTDIPINESRVASDWDQKWNMGYRLSGIRDESVIKTLLDNIRDSNESGIIWPSGASFSNAWERAIGETPIVEIETAGYYTSLIQAEPKVYELPASLCKKLMAQFPSINHIAGKTGAKGIKVKSMTKMQDHMIQKAFDFFKECDYEITAPINVCDFSSIRIIGQALDGEIYLSDKAFKGVRDLVIVLIEEQEHINSGFSDETREFQDHLFDLFLTEKMKRFSYVL